MSEDSKNSPQSSSSESPAAPTTGRPIPTPPSAHRRALNPYIDRLTDLPDHILNFPEAPQWKGRWQDWFDAPRPLWLELGSGYGHFLAALAEKDREHNYLGLELKYKRVFKAAEKAVKQNLPNLKYLRFDALRLDDAFAPGELSGVFVNFPDPWPKGYQERKRMVSKELVRTLETLVKPGGRVRLKSDWEPYRDWFRESFEGSAFKLLDYVPDLGQWDRPEDNIETTYERRFRRQGLPCFFYEFER